MAEKLDSKHRSSAFSYDFPEVIRNPEEWVPERNFILISSLDELESVFVANMGVPRVAIDTETNGLNIMIRHVVCITFAFTKDTGYMIPLRFQDNLLRKVNNLPIDGVMELINQYLLEKKIVAFNRNFDMAMLMGEGMDWWKKSEDAQIRCYHYDPNTHTPSLKQFAAYVLGLKMLELADVLGVAKSENMDFSLIHPEDGLAYACSDAVVTLELLDELDKRMASWGTEFINKVDQAVLDPVMYLTLTQIPADKPLLEKLNSWSTLKIDAAREEAHILVGRKFDLDSPKQLANILKGLGFDIEVTSKKGKKGESTDEEILLRYADKHPLPHAVLTYRKYSKFRNYIGPMLEFGYDKGSDRSKGRLPWIGTDPDFWVNFNYKVAHVPTGRWASGKAKDSHSTPLNGQNFLKPESELCYIVEEPTPEMEFNPQYMSKIFGAWVCYPRDIEDGTSKMFHCDKCPNKCGSVLESEGSSPFDLLNLRNTIVAPPGWYWVSIDFCIDPSTPIRTRDGVEPLSVLEKGPKEVWTPAGFKLAKNFRYTGKKRIVTLTLRDGRTLRCSEDHQFKVRTVSGDEVWKRVFELDPSDNLIVELPDV